MRPWWFVLTTLVGFSIGCGDDAAAPRDASSGDVLVVDGTTDASSAGLSVVVTATRTSCTAPCSITFSTAGSQWQGSESFVAIDYATDFGDTGASGTGSWRFGALADAGRTASKGQDTGPVVTHVYEEAGTFTATTTATAPDGATTSVQTQITVASPDVTWAGASTVCLSTTTDHTGCDTAGAVKVDNVTDLDAALVAAGCHNSSKRCLLHRGQSFTLSPRVQLSGTGARLLGTYGTGAKPIVTCAASCFELLDGASDVRMVDLDLRGSGVNDTGSVWTAQSGTNGTLDSAPDAHHMLCLRCDARHFNSVFFLHPNAPSSTLPAGIHEDIAIVDSDIRYSTGQGGPMVFMAGRYMTILGSRVGDMLLGAAGLPLDTTRNDRGEHSIRFKYCHECVFAHSSFGLFDDTDPGDVPGQTVVGCDYAPNWTQGGLVLTLRDGFAVDYVGLGRPASDARSRYEVLHDLLISSCRYTAFDLSLGATDATVQKAPEGHEYMLIDGVMFRSDFNDQTGQTDTGSAIFLNLMNMRHVGIRNVAFDATDRTRSQTGIALRINPAQVGDPNHIGLDDVRIQNVSYAQNGATASGRSMVAMFCASGTCPTNVTIDGLAAFDGDGQVSLVVPDTGTPTCCGGACPGTCNVRATTNPFAGSFAGIATLADFLPAASSPVLDQQSCSTAPRRDAFGQCRSGATCDVGAIELGGTTCN